MKKNKRRGYFLFALLAASLAFNGLFSGIGDFFNDAKKVFSSAGSLFQNVFGTACNDILRGSSFSGLCPKTTVFPNSGPIGSTWQVNALALQRNLEKDLPLKDSTFLHTHNSYNSDAYANVIPPRYLDPNQKYSIYDQLRMGIRAVELDVHYYYRAADAMRRRPMLCHAKENHIGCSVYDRTLEEGLDEIAKFLRENPTEVIMIYIEEYLNNNYQDGLDRIKSKLGDRIYRPGLTASMFQTAICSGGPCSPTTNACRDVPVNISRQQVLNKHKNIILYSNNCGKGEWLSWIYHKDNNSIPESNVSNFTPYPACGKEAEIYASKMVRFYEDKTHLSEIAGDSSGNLTPAIMTELIACGVNLPGMDKLKPDDGRLEAAIYTWNKDEPNNEGNGEDCAMQYANGRWNDAGCEAHYRFACRNAEGDWKLSQAAGTWHEGVKICNDEDKNYQFAVPRNGQENKKLLQARADERTRGRGGDDHLWLKFSDLVSEGNWKQ